MSDNTEVTNTNEPIDSETTPVKSQLEEAYDTYYNYLRYPSILEEDHTTIEVETGKFISVIKASKSADIDKFVNEKEKELKTLTSTGGNHNVQAKIMKTTAILTLIKAHKPRSWFGGKSKKSKTSKTSKKSKKSKKSKTSKKSRKSKK